MHRKSRSTTAMGLLDGLQSLQGPPAPQHSAPLPDTNHPSTTQNDPMAAFSSSTKSLFSSLTTSLSTSTTNLNDNLSTSVTSLRRMLGDESVDLEAPPDQLSFSDEMAGLFNLSPLHRLLLFAMIFATGLLLLFISFSFLPLLIVMPHKFAASFTLGNILAILSTCVLVGPRAQFNAMFHPVRAVAATVYFVSLLVVLFAAFFGGKLRFIFVIIALVAEIASLIWYAMSYIPYGRHAISRLIGLVGFTG
eukprot:GFKZ01003689.1.p1 GENE.GFKZ01003689.1~~GFKZ01003689.1.p1  ORF type:complete len:249 (-),score=34.33 GFKZ01003689.1:796-1542(-)